MAVKMTFEKQPDGGFAIVFEEDGSGDLNRVMGDLCEKHRIARERGEDKKQTPQEICQEIIQTIGGEKDKTESEGDGNC